MSRRSRTNSSVANWKVCARLICGLNCQSKFLKGCRSGNCASFLRRSVRLWPLRSGSSNTTDHSRGLSTRQIVRFMASRITSADNAEYKKVPSIPPTIFTETVAPSRSV